MFHTPPKNLNQTFVESERQPTDTNTDPDIIERDISLKPQKTSQIPSVSFTIPVTSTSEPLGHTPVTGKNTQSEMNLLKNNSNDLNPHLNQTLQTINEKSTGIISKLRRSSRVLDFSNIDLTEDHNSNFDLSDIFATSSKFSIYFYTNK